MKLTPLSTKIAAWLQRLAADHGVPALIVAKIVGSTMIEKGADIGEGLAVNSRLQLSRISDLTKLSPTIVFGMVDLATTIILTGVPTIAWPRPHRLDDGARRHVQRRLVDVAGRHH
jgi:hypothetical protein